MKRSEINAMLKWENIEYMKGDESSMIGFVARLLLAKKKHLQRTEPYAINTIAELSKASYEVDNLLYDIEEVEEDA